MATYEAPGHGSRSRYARLLDVIKPSDEHHLDCECEECEGEYFAVQHRPDDCVFDGDERERYYQPRQNRYDRSNITNRRPRS